MGNLAWAWGDITKGHRNDIWEKSLKRFVHDFKGFGKSEKVTKISKAAVEMANSFHLCVDENDIKKLLEVVPEELTSEDLMQLERTHIAEGKTNKQKKWRGTKAHSEGFRRFMQTPSLKTWTPTPKAFH